MSELLPSSVVGNWGHLHSSYCPKCCNIKMQYTIYGCRMIYGSCRKYTKSMKIPVVSMTFMELHTCVDKNSEVLHSFPSEATPAVARYPSCQDCSSTSLH